MIYSVFFFVCICSSVCIQTVQVVNLLWHHRLCNIYISFNTSTPRFLSSSFMPCYDEHIVPEHSYTAFVDARLHQYPSCYTPVQVTYDPKETTFTKLLEAFAAQTDVTQMNRQGSDRGTQYRCGVYYHTEEQKADTQAYFQKLNEEIAAGKRKWAGQIVVAELKPAGPHPSRLQVCALE
jgi:Peptide methionine sulfoxide reductase